jgi:hypothetical protein
MLEFQIKMGFIGKFGVDLIRLRRWQQQCCGKGKEGMVESSPV